MAKTLAIVLPNEPTKKKREFKVERSNSCSSVPRNIIQGIETLKEISAAYEKKKTG